MTNNFNRGILIYAKCILVQKQKENWKGSENMKKEQIIESARELFYQYGYKKVSMGEIAENANVTKRTLYSYFKDKDELLKYFIEEEINNMKKIVEDIEKENLPFLENVHKTILKVFEYKKKKPFIKVLTKEYEKLRNKTIDEQLKLLDKNIQEYIKGKVAYAVENGYIKKCDIDIVSFIIYKIYIALVFEWDENNKELNEKEITDNIMQVLKYGIFTEKSDFSKK